MMASRSFTILLMVAAMGFSACNEARESSAPAAAASGPQPVRVEFTLRDPEAAPLFNAVAGQGPAQIGTSLIVAVPAATTPTPYFHLIPSTVYLDRAKLDLATSRVTLNLVTETPLRLFEYVFNDTLTLPQVLEQALNVGTMNVSTPFTITAGTTLVDTSMPLSPFAFAEPLGTYLDPRLWGGSAAESYRFVENGELIVGSGGRDRPAISSVVPTLNNATITSMQADVRVGSVDATGGAQPRGRLAGFFYHTATAGEAAGSNVGDIYGEISLSDSQAQYIVVKCLSAKCEQTQVLTPGETFVGLGAVATGTSVTLGIAWNSAANPNQFTFFVSGSQAGTFDPGVPISGPPNRPLKFIGTRVGQGLGQTGRVQAVFDNVFLNGTLYDDFSTPAFNLDRTKWTTWGGARVVGGLTSAFFLASAPPFTAGELILNVAAEYSGIASADGAGQSSFFSSNRNLLLSSHRIAGTLQLNDATLVEIPGNPKPAEISTEARLIYQPRADRGLGSKNTTVARIEIINQGAGPVARLRRFTCDDAPCSTFSSLDTKNFSTPVNVSLPTPAFPFVLEYSGGGFFTGIFNGETRTITMPPAAVFNANDFKHAGLRTRARRVHDIGDRGQITTVFRDLEVGALPGGGRASLRVPAYDSFSGQFLDGSLWRDAATVTRSIQDDGSTTNKEFVFDVSGFGFFSEGLDFQDPEDISGLSADVRLISATNVPNGVSAHVRGGFYSDGTDTIEAEISLGPFGVFFSVNRCPEISNCQQLASGSAGGALSAVATNLAVLWNGQTTFSFVVDSGAPTIVNAASFAPFGGAALERFKGVGFFAGLDVSTAGSFVAAIDNVITLGLPLISENFESGTIDPAIWEDGIGHRKLVGGRLEMEAQNGGSFLEFREGVAVDALSADVTVLNQSGSGRAFLIKGLFNVANGVVLGLITMDGTEAAAVVVLCSLPDCETATVVNSTLLGATPLGTPHGLFLQWDPNAKAATFQLDANPPVTVTPAALGLTLTGPPAFDFTEISVENLDVSGPTIAFNSPGTIRATFDNVRAGGPTLMGGGSADTTAPGPVTGLSTSPGGPGQINLSWNNPSDNDLYGVLIRRATPGCPTSPTDGTAVADVPAGGSGGGGGGFFTDTGLAPSTTYFYTLFAHDFVPNYDTGTQNFATTPP